MYNGYAGSMHPASYSWMRWTASAVPGLTAVAAVFPFSTKHTCTMHSSARQQLIPKYNSNYVCTPVITCVQWVCREHAPSIIFMDEVDSIGSARSDSGGGGGGGDSEVQRTMLELLNQLDGFEATNKIKVSHATSGHCLLMWVTPSASFA